VCAPFSIIARYKLNFVEAVALCTGKSIKMASVFWKIRKFATKWYATLCILVMPIVRNRVTKLEFS